MKKPSHVLLLIFLIFIMYGLSSCHQNNNSHDAEYPQLNDSEIIIDSKSGRLISNLQKVSDVTSYKSLQNTSNLLSRPCVTINNDLIYLVRNYPEELNSAEEYQEYVKNKTLPAELEIHSVDNGITKISQFPLTEMQGGYFVGITYNPDNTISVVGNFTDDNKNTFKKLCIYNSDGGIVSEHEIDFTKIVDIKPYTHYMVYIDDDDLTITNVRTVEDTVISHNVIAFTITDSIIYYVNKKVDDEYNENFWLCKYDIHEKTTANIRILTDCSNISSIAYNPSKDALYYSTGENLYCLIEDTRYRIATSYDSYLSAYQITDNYLLLSNDYNQLSLYKLPQKAQNLDDTAKVINICELSSESGHIGKILSAAQRAMAMDGINIIFNETVTVPSSNEYNHTLAKKLLSSDSDFDIVFLNTYTPDLYEAQYYHDLSQYNLLRNIYDKMLPGAKNICSMENSLTLVPLALSANIIGINPSYSEYPLVFPDLLTDFIDYKDAAVSYLNQDVYFLKSSALRILADPWLDQFVTNFMNKRVDDQTAYNDLFFLIETMMKLKQEPKVYLNPTLSGIKNFLAITTTNGNESSTNSNIHLLPALNTEYDYCINGSYLAVNKNSPNKELSALLLAYMMQIDADSSKPVSVLYSSETQQSSEYTLFTEQLSKGARTINISDLPLYLYDIFESVGNGTITVAEATEDIFNKLKFIRDE